MVRGLLEAEMGQQGWTFEISRNGIVRYNPRYEQLTFLRLWNTYTDSMGSTGFGWYKDLALAICVFTLVVVGLATFVEPAHHGNEHRQIMFGIAVLVAATVCILFATVKSVVLTAALGILLFRSVIAIALHPTEHPIFIGIAVASGIGLYALLRFQPLQLPYDPDKASFVISMVAAAFGFGLAVALVRTLRFFLGRV
jgi:hypothetical protein